MKQRSYLLISRVRDEESFLTGLFESVENQTVRPVLWVIVDHDSKDNSGAILSEFGSDKDWVRIVKVKADDDYGLFTHARPLRKGFQRAVSLAEQRKLDYDYLGIQDSDIVPEKDYYEKLLRHMEKNPEIGITGGRLYLPKEDGEVPEDAGQVVRGGSRIYRRKCFEDIGGEMPESAIWDTETDVLAELRGWKSFVVMDASGLHKRKTATRKGVLKGFWRRGRCFHYANYDLITILLLSAYFTVKPPFLSGLYFFGGFVISWIKGEEQSTNPEIRDHFHHSFSRFLGRLKIRIRHLFKSS